MQKGVNCPLCKLNLKEEKVYFEDGSFIFLETKLKDHKERIMIVYKRDEHELPYRAIEHDLDIITRIGRKRFSYTPKFVIMDSTFATISNHWHLVATNLDPKSEYFDKF